MVNAEQAKVQIATQTAESWLALTDNGKYEDSWGAAAGFFKNAVTKQQWIQSMNAFRKPLGKVIERKLQNKQYTTDLPGAPDGEYVVLQYATSFEHKKTAIETITPMLDADGQWRISGYYIK
jgi:hypothetical protein